MWIYKNTVVLFITMQLKNKTFTIYPYTSTQYTPVILAAVIWLKYCRYGLKHHPIINQSNAEIREYDFFKLVKTDSKISYNGFYLIRFNIF